MLAGGYFFRHNCGMTNKPRVTIYSDGGARPNPGFGGWGVVMIFPEQQQELSGGERATTNNRMELTAAMSALEALDGPHQIDFYTDSEYVKNGITQWINGWIKKGWRDVKNPDLWQRLHNATQRHDIKWHWVKAHAGHAYNERVDELATLEIERLSGKQTIRKPEPESPAIKADVLIYVASAYSFDDKRGGWGALVTGNGPEAELRGTENNSSDNQLVLIASIAALETVRQPASIAVFTSSEYLQKGMSQWVKGWMKKGWKTASGDPVKNQSLWERLVKVAEPHQIQWLMQTKAQGAQTQRAFELATK